MIILPFTPKKKFKNDHCSKQGLYQHVYYDVPDTLLTNGQSIYFILLPDKQFCKPAVLLKAIKIKKI